MLYNLFLIPLLFGISCAFLAVILSPLQFLKIIRQETNSSYSSIISSYYKSQGFWVFFRGWRPYAFMQFLSSSIFGLSEYISGMIFVYCRDCSTVSEVLFRAFLGAAFETAVTIKAEVVEIARNKKEYMKSEAKISYIVFAIFMRNAIFWSGGISAFKIMTEYNLSSVYGALLALALGLITGFITIPLDAMSTRNCGTLEPKSIINGIADSYNRGGLSMIFSGAMARTIIIACYTANTEIMIQVVQNSAFFSLGY